MEHYSHKTALLVGLQWEEVMIIVLWEKKLRNLKKKTRN